MSFFGKLKKGTHKIAHNVGKVAGKVTGSDKVAKLAEQAVLNNPIGGGLNVAYQAAHHLGHLGTSVEKKLNPKTPEVNVPETVMPDYSETFDKMGEYLAAMQEAMTKVEPASEPLKAAQTEMSQARADTDRKQLLRRGLMSTYTRYGSQGGTQKLGA